MAAQTARPLSLRFPLLSLLICTLAIALLVTGQAQAEVTAYNLDDADPTVTYSGTWTAVSNVPTALYSTLHWSNTPGNSVSASYYGTTITYFYTMAGNMGERRVYLDGALVDTFSGAAGETRRQVGRTYTRPTGGHTIRVEVAGSGGAYGFTDVDLFAVDIASVGTGSYDDQNVQVRYFGTWSNSTFVNGTYGNTLKTTTTNLSGFRFTFSGDKVTYLFSKSTNRGKAVVTIDGLSRGNIDQYAPDLQRQQGVMYSNLGSGPHVLNVVYTGQKNPLSTGTFIDLDAVVVGNVYNRAAAVAYADQWAHGRNVDFPNYGYDWMPSCNDCTNFVSQVLLAGGIPEIEYINYDNQYYWYMLTLPTGGLYDSNTWSATDWFKSHLTASPWRYQLVGEGPGFPLQLSGGDFFVIDIESNPFQGPDHASVVVGYGPVEEGDSIGEMRQLRNAHCRDRKRVRWDYGLTVDDIIWSYRVVY